MKCCNEPYFTKTRVINFVNRSLNWSSIVMNLVTRNYTSFMAYAYPQAGRQNFYMTVVAVYSMGQETITPKMGNKNDLNFIIFYRNLCSADLSA